MATEFLTVFESTDPVEAELAGRSALQDRVLRAGRDACLRRAHMEERPGYPADAAPWYARACEGGIQQACR
jgi:hypothetical protein